MKAVILAGGKGTRLRPLTYTKPKPLLPLAGEPAIAHLIRKLAGEGIDEIVLTTNYFASRLRAELGDGSRYGVRLRHVAEKSPLGTAGSVRNSQALIDGTFLVVQGDNQFDFDTKEVIRQHARLNASATLALVEVEDPSQYGIVDLSDGRITRFLEKPKPEECFSNLANSGFYVLEPEVLKLIPAGRPFDFSRNLFPLMLKSKMKLAGVRVEGFWGDIGDPDSYLKANYWALERLEPKIICGSDVLIPKTATVIGPVCLGGRVKIQRGAVIGPYSCVGEGSEVGAGTRIASSIVYENTLIAAGAVLNSCVVGENCMIGQRVRIERNAVVGAGTELGDDSALPPKTKVGPWAVVQTSAATSVTTRENRLERLAEFLQKPEALLGLTREEGRVCRVLLELGKADVRTIAEGAQLSISRVDLLLTELKTRGMITSPRGAPGMYALASLSDE